ncbi:ribosomal-processing cysteine protease Prp [Agrilactobacillus yilanensis]|uniref:Ribosomal processing cysteine protease Prp n=1 Tax=Agrilactobacillus yilanensis TaxID=2485997 RepID=A0ABW4JC87_9LACO|nr:ribosomal-processing cysteine protease Prp [Agrilactobacillus yilanensis]
MISAHFFRNSDGNIERFRITGHADAGEYGQDIVCAAVSATAIGTTNSLENLAGIEPIITADEQNGGLLEVAVPLKIDKDKMLICQILLENLLGTLQSIETKYKDYIIVNRNNSEN